MYALIVEDADGNVVVSHVAWDSSEPLYVDHEEVSQREWRKASRFLDWVSKNKSDWKIFESNFDIEVRRGKLTFVESE